MVLIIVLYDGVKLFIILRHAAATLGSGNLRLAVMLPEGEDINEWVAVNTVDFFNQVNIKKEGKMIKNDKITISRLKTRSIKP